MSEALYFDDYSSEQTPVGEGPSLEDYPMLFDDSIPKDYAAEEGAGALQQYALGTDQVYSQEQLMNAIAQNPDLFAYLKDLSPPQGMPDPINVTDQRITPVDLTGGEQKTMPNAISAMGTTQLDDWTKNSTGRQNDWSQFSAVKEQDGGGLNRVLKSLGLEDKEGNANWGNILKVLGTVYFGDLAGKDIRAKQQAQVDDRNRVLAKVNTPANFNRSGAPHTGLVTGMGSVTGGPLANMLRGN